MEYLLVMTISGSTMTVVCGLVMCLMKNKVSARMNYLLAKAAVLYYLIPLPFLKGLYGRIFRVILPEAEMEIAHIPLARTSYTVNADGSIYLNRYAGIQIGMIAGWLLVAVILMARRLVKYLRTARWISGYTGTKMTDRQKEYLGRLKGEYRIRRQVLLYQGETGEPSMTFGIYRPVIICGREVGSRGAELLVRHELVHIRRLDAFWKMIMQFVVFLHWWNLVMWLLYVMLDRLCELSCDETVVLGKPEEEVDEYLLLLIQEAQEEKEPEKFSLEWESGFGNNKREIMERMENLMRNRRWNKFAAGTLVAALVFANSMTVLAYRDVHNEIMPEDVSQEEIESSLQWDTVALTFEETGEDVLQYFDEQGTMEILYDRQFTDGEGNIYPIPEMEPQWGCNHTYEPGTEAGHKKNSDGSCDVTVYKAQRCTKCGTVVRGDFVNSVHYAICPH